MNPKDYEGREQAYVKHWVLERYLQVLAFKIGQYRPGTTFNYIDGFSGPFDHGATRSSDRPTSPHLALKRLRETREQLRSRGTSFSVRGLFVERSRPAFERLQTLLGEWGDIETPSYNGAFEDHIEDAVAFAKTGRNPFAFVFIDPIGWTGYGLHAIAPLLRVRPSEVLINFMFKAITRFIDHDDSKTRESFQDLFGQRAEEYRANWRGLTGADREDAIVTAYCERVREIGGFEYCASTIVLNPEDDRTHYHLIYATRSRAGLIAFRDIERQALGVQTVVRAARKESRRVRRTQQPSLFEATAIDTRYLVDLQDRYRDRACNAILELLSPIGAELPYERVFDRALLWPMVSSRDLGIILDRLRKEGRIELIGLKGRETRLKLLKGHRIRRLRE